MRTKGEPAALSGNGLIHVKLFAVEQVARGINPSSRLRQVLRHTSQFRSLEKQLKILCFSLCVTTFEASLSESGFSLSEECAGTCASRSSRLSVKGCYQSGMPCVGSSSSISSFVFWITVLRGQLVRICLHRFPACSLVTSSRYQI